jgi:hypothetical protein
MESAGVLAVCDIFFHRCVLHTPLRDALPNGAGSTRSPPGGGGSPAHPLNFLLALQFVGTASPVPTVLLPFGDALSLHDDVRVRLGKEDVEVALERGKSACIPFPRATVPTTTNPDDAPPPPRVQLLLLASSETDARAGAQFVASGAFDLGELVGRALKPSPRAGDGSSSAAADSTPPSALAQFRVPVLTLGGTEAATFLVSCKVSSVPDALRPFFAQQAAAQAVASSGVAAAASRRPAAAAASSSATPLDALRPPVTRVATVRGEMEGSGGAAAAAAASALAASTRAATVRGRAELTSCDVFMPPPVWFGTLGPVAVPAAALSAPAGGAGSSTRGRAGATATARQSGQTTTAHHHHHHGGGDDDNDDDDEPAVGETRRTMAPSSSTVGGIRSMPLGFADGDDGGGGGPVDENAAPRLPTSLTDLDGLLADLIRWRDYVKKTNETQAQAASNSLRSPGGRGGRGLRSPPRPSGSSFASTPGGPLSDGVSASMAALQNALVTTGMGEAAASRVVRTLGPGGSESYYRDTGEPPLPAQRNVSFSAKSSAAPLVGAAKAEFEALRGHELFGGEERTRALLAALPRTFRVLRGGDVAGADVQAAIEAIYEVAKGKTARAAADNDNDNDATGVPSAGSPLRRTGSGFGGFAAARSPGRSSVGGGLRLPAGSSLANSPYAKPLLNVSSASAAASGRRPATAPQPSAGSASFDALETSTAWGQAGPGTGTGPASVASGGGEPVRGVRLTTAMRARLAALEEDKRAERLKATREAAEVAAVGADLWAAREESQRHHGPRAILARSRSGSAVSRDSRERGDVWEFPSSAAAAAAAVDSSFRSGVSGERRVTQAERDARRSAGYPAPVAPDAIPALHTSPHKAALGRMPSARASAAATAGGGGGGSPVKGVVQGPDVAAPSSTAVRASIELPGTSTFLSDEDTAAAGAASASRMAASSSVGGRATMHVTTFPDAEGGSSPSHVQQRGSAGAASALAALASPGDLLQLSESNSSPDPSSTGRRGAGLVDETVVSSVRSSGPSTARHPGETSAGAEYSVGSFAEESQEHVATTPEHTAGAFAAAASASGNLALDATGLSLGPGGGLTSPLTPATGSPDEADAAAAAAAMRARARALVRARMQTLKSAVGADGSFAESSDSLGSLSSASRGGAGSSGFLSPKAAGAAERSALSGGSSDGAFQEEESGGALGGGGDGSSSEEYGAGLGGGSRRGGGQQQQSASRYMADVHDLGEDEGGEDDDEGEEDSDDAF